nr:aminotransferase class IV [Nakamurella flavida]
MRGDGIFDTTLAVDGRPRDLDDHLARLFRSAAMIDLVLPGQADWRRGVDAILRAWTGGREMVLRLAATRGPDGAGPTCYVTGAPLAAASIAQREDGVRIVLLPRGFSSAAGADHPWLLSGAKTISYAINMAALRWAHEHDADDAVFSAADGHVLEAPTASVVLVPQDAPRTLVTPPDQGVLESITVRTLFAAAERAGWRTERRPVPVGELHAAQGLWLASSARLLAPVTAVDGVPREDTALARALNRELADLLDVPR